MTGSAGDPCFCALLRSLLRFPLPFPGGLLLPLGQGAFGAGGGGGGSLGGQTFAYQKWRGQIFLLSILSFPMMVTWFGGGGAGGFGGGSPPPWVLIILHPRRPTPGGLVDCCWRLVGTCRFPDGHSRRQPVGVLLHDPELVPCGSHSVLPPPPPAPLQWRCKSTAAWTSGRLTSESAPPPPWSATSSSPIPIFFKRGRTAQPWCT